MNSKKKKSGKRRRETLFDIKWNTKLDALKKFRKEFTHCNVPQYWKKDKSLGRWVIRQRVWRKSLSAERFEKLNRIGFVWNIPDHLWEKSYQKLVEYKNSHGDCEVPKGKKKFYELAEWVSKQRGDKKKKLKRLTPKKIAKLNKLDFYWGRKNTPWERRFAELKQFKARFGHCRVPQGWKENKPLANWVAIQRRNRKKLSKERYGKLNQIGFQWSVRPGRIPNGPTF